MTEICWLIAPLALGMIGYMLAIIIEEIRRFLKERDK